MLKALALFLRIVEKGSLAAAGREAGLSAATVSERLAALEKYFGVVLLNRTTRSLSLPDEGRALHDGSKLVLAEMDNLEARIRSSAHILGGPIRISAPSDLGRTVVAQVIDEFALQHPAITVELLLADGFSDVVGDGIESARDLWRLQPLRRWSHEQVEQVLT